MTPVDWKKILEKHDFILDEHAVGWGESAFLGNGEIGVWLVWKNGGAHGLRVMLGHTSVYDNRTSNGGSEKDLFKRLFFSGRLPVGELNFMLPGKLQEASMRLRLWDATVEGRLRTDKGDMPFTLFAAAEHPGILIDWKEGEAVWIPALAESPRQKEMRLIQDERRQCPDYAAPKPGITRSVGNTIVHEQPYFSGGGFAVASIVAPVHGGMRMSISVAEGKDLKRAGKQALVNAQTALDQYESIRNTHEDWWSAYYQNSYLALSDEGYEGFYWRQLYKLASATRADGRVIDTCGPWLTDRTSWPATWWNLNVQLVYSPLYAAGQLSVASSLPNTLKREMATLIRNVPEKYREHGAGIGRFTTRTLDAPLSEPAFDGAYGKLEYGNLIWALHNCYRHFRMCMDDELLRSTVYPLLKRAVWFVIAHLYDGGDGYLHLPFTVSPEYPKGGEDCTYTLALLRWGIETLDEIVRRLDLADEQQTLRKEALNRLAPYPKREDQGFLIADGVPLEESHRHYSHLLMCYPLGLLPADDPDVLKTLVHWKSMPGALEGYSLTGMASIHALLGQGNEALQYLDELMTRFILPNTMYRETGGPVMETPPSAACTMQEMLLRSAKNSISVFPAVPDRWTDIHFENFRAEGGFMISAQRIAGRLAWVRIRSLCGEKAYLTAPFRAPCQVHGCEFRDGRYEIALGQGEEILLRETDGKLAGMP